MKVIIENRSFNYDIGCGLLKLRYEKCPFPELRDIWDDIIPATFSDISQFSNVEDRRIGILCLGIERLIKEVEPVLVSKETIKKKTVWVKDDGTLEKKEYEDIYELYTVSSSYLNKKGSASWDKIEDCQFVKCRDTSTDREYMIWVDNSSVARTNHNRKNWFSHTTGQIHEITAIEAIAWTIQTDVPEGNIEKIVRQGDCILVKSNSVAYESLSSPRHLTGNEYKKYLKLES